MEVHDREYVFHEYKRANLKLLLSGLVLFVAMPLITAFIIIVLFAFFVAGPLIVLFLANPPMLVLGAILLSLGLANVLARMYNNWYVKNPLMLSFLVIFTNIIFLYGAYYVLLDRDTFNMLDYSGATYFGMSAKPITLVLALFCVVSPVIYAILLEGSKKMQLIALVLPLALATLNTFALSSLKDVERYAYPEDVSQLSKQDRKPDWISVPGVDLEGYAFDDCYIFAIEKTLHCTYANIEELAEIDILMSQVDSKMSQYLFEDGKCDIDNLQRYLNRGSTDKANLQKCGEILTPGGRSLYGRKNIESASGNYTYAYFVEGKTVVLFSAKTNQTILDPNELSEEFGAFVDSFN